MELLLLKQLKKEKKYKKKSSADKFIDSYLAEAEKNYSTFDDDDGYNNFDEMNYYTEASQPYKVNIVNSTGGNIKTLLFAKKAVLFGANELMMSANYGSDSGIEITPTISNVSYLELLNHSAQQPFEVTKIRITCSNTEQFKQAITIQSKNVSGACMQFSIRPKDYYDDNQYQTNIIDINKTIRIDGNTQLFFNVLDDTDMTVTLFTGGSKFASGLNDVVQLNIKNKASVKVNKMLLLLNRN